MHLCLIYLTHSLPALQLLQISPTNKMKVKRTSQLYLLLITQQDALLGHSNSFLLSFLYSLKGQSMFRSLVLMFSEDVTRVLP